MVVGVKITAKQLFEAKNQLPKTELRTIKKERKADALALANLIYDIFKEEQASAKIIDGQNNAQQNSNN